MYSKTVTSSGKSLEGVCGCVCARAHLRTVKVYVAVWSMLNSWLLRINSNCANTIYDYQKLRGGKSKWTYLSFLQNFFKITKML